MKRLAPFLQKKVSVVNSAGGTFHWNYATATFYEIRQVTTCAVFMQVWGGTFCYSVFLTHVSISQMPMRLPTWKAKSLYHVGTFLPTWFILPLKNCTDIFKYICFTLYLHQTVNNWERAIVFIDCHCLWCFFFSVDIRSNKFRVYLFI